MLVLGNMISCFYSFYFFLVSCGDATENFRNYTYNLNVIKIGADGTFAILGSISVASSSKATKLNFDASSTFSLTKVGEEI
jgi:hypothetical protein